MEAIIVGVLITYVVIRYIRQVWKEELQRREVKPKKQITTTKPKPLRKETKQMEIAPEMASNHRSNHVKKRKRSRSLSISLKQGVIMKEILDEPRSKKPFRIR